MHACIYILTPTLTHTQHPSTQENATLLTQLDAYYSNCSLEYSCYTTPNGNDEDGWHDNNDDDDNYDDDDDNSNDDDDNEDNVVDDGYNNDNDDDYDDGDHDYDDNM